MSAKRGFGVVGQRNRKFYGTIDTVILNMTPFIAIHGVYAPYSFAITIHYIIEYNTALTQTRAILALPHGTSSVIRTRNRDSGTISMFLSQTTTTWGFALSG